MKGKSMDLIIVETKEHLTKILNASGLPITVLGMIVRELNMAVDNQIKITLEKQIKECAELERNDIDGN